VTSGLRAIQRPVFRHHLAKENGEAEQGDAADRRLTRGLADFAGFGVCFAVMVFSPPAADPRRSALR